MTEQTTSLVMPPTQKQMWALRQIENVYNVAIDYSDITTKEYASKIIYRLNRMIKDGQLGLKKVERKEVN